MCVRCCLFVFFLIFLNFLQILLSLRYLPLLKNVIILVKSWLTCDRCSQVYSVFQTHQGQFYYNVIIEKEQKHLSASWCYLNSLDRFARKSLVIGSEKCESSISS